MAGGGASVATDRFPFATEHDMLGEAMSLPAPLASTSRAPFSTGRTGRLRRKSVRAFLPRLRPKRLSLWPFGSFPPANAPSGEAVRSLQRAPTPRFFFEGRP